MKVLIHSPAPLNRNAGGPPGYLWHLRHGLQRNGSTGGIEFHETPLPPRKAPVPPSELPLKSRIEHSLRRVDPLWRLARSHLPCSTSSWIKETLSHDNGEDRFPSAAFEALKDGGYDVVHVHATRDCIRAHNDLMRLGKRSGTSLCLTSHCPEMPGREIADMMVAEGLTAKAKEQVGRRLVEDDLHAFSLADVLVFPCPEAMEPYRAGSPLFETVTARKKVLFLHTGLADLPVREPKDRGPNHRQRFSYVGRHIPVKGYDMLVEAARSLLAQGVEVAFDIAGRKGEKDGLDHPAWVEHGWIDWSHDLIGRSDAFVLANRQTYFDLVAIEVMALGVPLLASNTGGNKLLGRLSKGVTLFEPDARSLAACIRDFGNLDEGRRRRMGDENREAFEENFTAETFARSYANLLPMMAKSRETDAVTA